MQKCFSTLIKDNFVISISITFYKIPKRYRFLNISNRRSNITILVYKDSKIQIWNDFSILQENTLLLTKFGIDYFLHFALSSNKAILYQYIKQIFN